VGFSSHPPIVAGVLMHSFFIPLAFASGRRRRRCPRHAGALLLLAAAAFVGALAPSFTRSSLPHPAAQFSAYDVTAEVWGGVPSMAPIVDIIGEQRPAAWAGPQGDHFWLRDSALRASVTLTSAADGFPCSLPAQEKGTWQHLGRPPPATGGHTA
jgi:hypothetical protein